VDPPSLIGMNISGLMTRTWPKLLEQRPQVARGPSIAADQIRRAPKVSHIHPRLTLAYAKNPR
jgi:hypothetical protein